MEDKLLNITKVIEKQVDQAIEQIDNLNVNDLESLRKSRMDEIKKQAAQRDEWLANGHGKYEEMPEEKSFFDIIKKSQNIVMHFYTNSSPRCAILDMHLKTLAPKHLEARFVKFNAEKCPFLTEKLKIKTIPTVVLVQNSVMVDKIIGFSQLGNTDEFSTETLEWRIAQNNVITYEGDLTIPPFLREESKTRSSNKKIRDGAFNKDDDELDIEEDALARETYKTKDGLPQQSSELTAEELAELGLDDD